MQLWQLNLKLKIKFVPHVTAMIEQQILHHDNEITTQMIWVIFLAVYCQSSVGIDFLSLTIRIILIIFYMKFTITYQLYGKASKKRYLKYQTDYLDLKYPPYIISWMILVPVHMDLTYKVSYITSLLFSHFCNVLIIIIKV